jgi:hypothetical protein
MDNVFSQFNFVDVIRLVEKRKKVHQRIMLEGLEQVLDRDSVAFKEIRKLILDHTNDFSRTILKELLGPDYEGEIK